MQKAKNQAEAITTEEIRKANLEDINRDNLLKGLDSEGANMPPYVNPDYANFKTMINPSNRGFWDLKLSGQYHQGISYKIDNGSVSFFQKFHNQKIDWLNVKFAFNDVTPLGITSEQLSGVKTKVGKEIQKRLNNIILGK